MKIKSMLFILLAVPLFFSCEKDNPAPWSQEPVQIQLTEKASQVILRNNAFGINLFTALAQEEPETKHHDLFVEFVKQNSLIQLNEEGTEAATVITIGIGETSVPQSFVVDKPFIFAIREQTTNTLIFI